MIETNYDSNRSQLIFFDQLYGEFILETIVIENQVGMNNNYVASSFGISFSSASSYYQ